MTLDEFEEKIAQLKVVKSKATGVEAMKLMDIISDLSVSVAELETSFLMKLEEGMSAQDFTDLKKIADDFNAGADDLANRIKLIDNAISIGKKIVSIVA